MDFAAVLVRYVWNVIIRLILDLAVICGFTDLTNLIGGLLLEELSLPLSCTVDKSVGMELMS